MTERQQPINGNGNGAHHSHPTPPPVAAEVPKGAPVEPSKPVDVSSGSPPSLPPEPLVVVDEDAEVEREPVEEIVFNRKQRAFLVALEEGLTKTGAAKAAKIGRTSIYDWINETDGNGKPTERAIEFKKRVDAAYTAGTEALIDEAKRRAVEGWDEPRFDKEGNETGAVRKYDSTLLMFLIKQRDPSFRERYEVTGANGSPLNPSKLDINVGYADALKSLSDEELRTHNEIAAKLLARSGQSIPPRTN